MPVTNSLTVSEYQAKTLAIIEIKDECIKCEVPFIKNNSSTLLIDDD